MRSARHMILGLAAILLLAAATAALAERGDDADRKSKNGRLDGTIDGVEITVEFGRPNVKEREIWGGLVPYDKVWRTGADEATTIRFGGDVTIGGKQLAAGTYSLFTIPGEDEWTFVFNKAADQWGAYDYDSGQDALRVTATPREAEKEESMNFFIDGNAVVLHWDQLAVGFELASAG